MSSAIIPSLPVPAQFAWSPQGPVLELGELESWQRLSSCTLGHLGLVVDEQPEIYPVNYLCDGETVLFRTAAGEKLRELMVDRRVAFEVDAAVENGTWSVVVTGRATVLDDEPSLTDRQLDRLPPWIPTQRMVWVRITPERVRGRLFEHRLPVVRL